MKNKKIGLLSVSLSMVACLFAGTYFYNEKPNGELTAESLPESELYVAPATVVSPYTYTDSPTNEPWYSSYHSYKSTATNSDGVYYQRNQKATTFDFMNITNTWKSYRGENVKVAVIDTGCYTSHEDFNGTNIKTISKNMVSGTTGLSAVNDTHGHGTSSAATIAAAINGKGGTGIAPNVQLIILKCVDSNNGFSNTAITNALQYCIDNKVDVINMSIQGYNVSSNFSSEWFEDFGKYTVKTTSSGIMTPGQFSTKLKECHDAGITLVAAAGNYNTDKKSYPAANDYVIAVGSTGLESATSKAGYSNYGDWLDISAPGYVYTPVLDGTDKYSVTNGTSFSAPLVTGAIALYKSKYPDATPDEIEAALKTSAQPISWQGGAGALDVDNFLATPPYATHVESLSLSENEKTLTVGETYQIVPTILPSDADQRVTYESYDTDVCTVDENGLITAVGEGESFIEVTSVENNSCSDTIYITVEKAQVTSTEVTVDLSKGVRSGTPTNIVWTIDGVGTIKQEKGTGSNDVANYITAPRFYQNHLVTFTPAEGNTFTKIQFTCSSESYATVLKNSTWSEGTAGSSGSVVTWTGSESSPFTVTLGAQARISAIKITYSSSGGPTPVNPTLTKIEITSNSHRSFAYGASFVKETVTATYSDGSTADVTNDAAFDGYNSNNSGQQTITVTYGGKTTTYTVMVSAPNPTVSTVTITGGTAGQTLIVGNTLQLGATVAGTHSPAQTVTWSSSNSCTASVSSSGLVTAKAAGNVTITATSTVDTTKKGTLSLVIANKQTSYDPGDYYKTITATGGNALLGALHDLSVTKHTKYNSYSQDLNTTNYFLTDPYSSSNTVIRDFYTGAAVKNEVVTSGTNGWNREHVWPQDLSNGLYGISGPGADFQHIRPTIAKINSDRGNKKYGELNNSGTASTTTDYYGNIVTGGYYNTNVFQPIASKKGDVARIVMYMYMHYNKATNIDGSKDGSTSSYFGTLNFTHVISATSEAAAKQLLLTWNAADPVDDIERIRNSESANIIGVRNPFIDHPEYADAIWGAKTLSSISVSNPKTDYEVGDTFVEPTVTAKYSDNSEATVTATFSGYNMNTVGKQTVQVSYKENNVTKSTEYDITVSAKTVSVTGVSLNTNSLKLSVGEDATLTATVSPDNATNKNVTWESSDTSVATVVNGKVTGVKAGDATITVKTVDGHKTDTCAVTVKSSGSTDAETKELSFSFTSNPGNWPTTNSTTLTNYTYTLDGVNYSFGLKNVKQNAASGSTPGYLMMTQPAALGLPAIDGYKLTKVEAKNTSSCSTTVYVGVSSSSSSESYVSGGSSIKWGSTNSTYTYNLEGLGNNTIYYLYVTNKNAQIASLDLTYEATGGSVTSEITNVKLSENTKDIDLYSYTKSFALTPTVTFKGEIDTTVTWSTSDPSVVSISSETSANETAITVTANKVGTATITATCGEESDTCVVNVTDSTNAHTVEDLIITPNKTSVPFMDGNGEVELTVKVDAVYKDGHKEENISPTSKNFKVDTTSLGEKEISATFGGVTKKATIIVTNNGADIGEKPTSQKTSIDYSFTSTSISSLPTDWTVSTSGTLGFDNTNGRGLQLQGSASCILTSPNLSNITSIDLYVSKSSNGKGSFTVTIGSTEVEKITNFNTTNTKVTITLEEAMNGVIQIEGSATASSLYIKQFVVNCETSSGEPHDATGLEQAIAWSSYLLNLTKPICDADPRGENGSKLSKVWSTLASEYGYMDSDAKSLFMSSNDPTISAARERYIHIANHYGNSFNFTGAQIASKNAIASLANLGFLEASKPENTLTIILISLGLISITGYFTFKKKKEF